MRLLVLTLSLLLLSGICPAQTPARTLRIEVATPPAGQNAAIPIRDAIQKAIDGMRTGEYLRAEVLLSAGEYRIEAIHGDPGMIFRIFGARNLTIRGAGSSTKLIIHDKTPNERGYLRKIFYIGDSDHLTLENFAIDFAPAAREWIQGRARDITLGEGAEAGFTLQLDAASPPFRDDCFKPGHALGIVLNKHLQPREDFPDYFEIVAITPTAKGTLKVQARIPNGQNLDRLDLLKDQRIVIARRNPGENLFYFGGANVEPALRNLHITASRGLCIEANGCDRLELDGVKIKRASKQWIASPGDGVHYANGLRGPYIHNCEFEGLGDDALNIYAKPFPLTSPGPGTYEIGDATVRPDDQLWIYSTVDPGAGQIVKAEAVRGTTFTGAPMDANIVPNRAVNLSRSGADFIIRDNHFATLRGLGCRLQTGTGIVERNTFSRLSGAPISLECGLGNSYDEGPFPYDIEIKNNHFDSSATSGYGRLAIRRVAPWDANKPHPCAFRNIRRSGNTVKDMQEASF